MSWTLGIEVLYKCSELISVNMILQASFVKDAPIPVNRVRWSPDGNIIGRYVFSFCFLKLDS